MRYFFLIISLIFPVVTLAQLTSPGMSALRYTSYPSDASRKDPVFIYCNASGSVSGSLNATSPGGTAPFNFSWYKWDSQASGFSASAFKTESGTASLADNLTEGGYKVTISGSDGYDTSLVAWIFIDMPYALAQLQNRTCDYVALKGRAAIDTFYYNDIGTGNKIKLPDAVKFMWSSDPASTIPYPDLELNPQTFTPPLVDVTYKIQVSDSFGCVSESSFFYESIHVKADFTVSPDNGEAPLEVSFTDKSIQRIYISVGIWRHIDFKAKRSRSSYLL